MGRRPRRSLRWRLIWSYTAVTVGALAIVLLVISAVFFSSIFIPYDQFAPEVWVQAVNRQTVPIARILLSQAPPDMEHIAEFVNYSDIAKLNGIDLLQMGSVTVFVRATAQLELLILDADGKLLGRTGSPVLPAGGVPLPAGGQPYLQEAVQSVYAGETDPAELISFKP